MSRDRDSYQMFYEIIPHVLRDEELRAAPARSSSSGTGALDAWALGRGRRGRAAPGPERAAGACSRWRMTDGLALQALADPDLDLGPAFESLAAARAATYVEAAPSAA